MPATTGEMEGKWQLLFANTDDKEWVDVVQSTTGEYYRLTVAGGVFRHWNRTSLAWESVTLPTNLIVVTPRSS